MTDALDEAYGRGAKAWDFGDKMPAMPPDDADLETMCFYLMMARARDYFRRRDMALYPESVEFRP